MKRLMGVLMTGVLVAASVAGCDSDPGSGGPSAPGTAASSGPTGGPSPGGSAPSGAAASPASSAPPCVAGSWRGTGVNGQFGSAAGRVSGGTGTAMTVGADGTTEVGFSSSEPLTFSAQAAGATVRGQIRYTGSLHAGVVFVPRGDGAGVWRPRDDARRNDLRVTVTLSEPVSVTLLDDAGIGKLTGAELPGTDDALDILPILRAGTYTCSGNTLRVRTEQNGPTLVWTFVRAS